MPRPVLSFTVRPTRGTRLHFDVRVYATLAAMRRAMRQAGMGPAADVWQGVGGLRRWWDGIGRPRAAADGRLGIIFLPEWATITTVAAHECLHAACTWARYRGWDLNQVETEERVATAMQRMAMEIGRRGLARGRA
jgi:hypothetical protein